MEEESSSGESVCYSVGSNSGSDSGDEEEGGPVNSRTRSRRGGLLAVVDDVPLSLRVHGWVAGAGRRDLHAVGPVHQGEVCYSATLLSVRGILNVELPVDISLFDHSCRQMEVLLRKRTAHSALQKMTFHTTSLAVRRVCAIVEDWPHLF